MATIRKRGTRYQVQVRRQGKAVSQSFIKLSDAKEWARMMEVAADRQELPDRIALRAEADSLTKTTLRQLVERYRDEVSPTHRAGETEQIVLNAFLRDQKRLCSKALAEVSAKDFVSYRDERLRTVSSATVKRQLVPLRHMFKVAVSEWGLKVANPLEALKIADSRPRERRLRQGEEARLLEAARCCRTRGIMPRVILFALETGMRRGEILAIRQQDIDWSEPSLLIPEAKNGHARTIPLSPAAVALLKAPTSLGTPCDGNPGDRPFPMTGNALRLAWERLCKRAGIEDLHFHDTRHEAISRLFEKGLSVPEVALISGHKDYRQLARYTHPLRRTILEKLEAKA